MRRRAQFQKLEKIEVGGNKGRTLSASVGQIHADFAKVLEAFVQVWNERPQP